MTAGIVMAVGILFFKVLPMELFGDDILFDASLHVTSTIFVLYIIWYFIDQNKYWRIPFFLFVAVVLSVVSFQRIAIGAHNDVGLLLGLSISLLAIIASRPDYFKGKFDF